MRFLHVTINVKDIDTSLEFYTKLLDMNLVNTIPFYDKTMYFLSDEDGQTQIALCTKFNTSETENTDKELYANLGFGVDSLKEFEEKLFSMGYGYLRMPTFVPELNSDVAVISDPDGNEIEIMED